MSYDVTILMPVYNAAAYLNEAVTSILRQSFTNFELLVIDDASTDESLQILQSFEDTRIRIVINEKNLGITETLNKGLALASADLVARMDADDISYPERIQKQFNFFQQNIGIALLSTAVRVVTATKQPVELYHVDHLYNCYSLNFICPIYHSTVMFKKSIVLELKGYTCKYAEDYDLWCRLFRVYKMAYLDEILLDYRLSSNSLSNVDKKTEYDQAGRDIMLENIRNHVGETFQLSFNEAECYRNVFEPICSSGNVKEMVSCIKKLDFINEKICASENINYSGGMLLPYARIKRDYTASELYNSLPKIKKVLFLIKIETAASLIKKFKNKIRRKLNLQK